MNADKARINFFATSKRKDLRSWFLCVSAV
jgi:hypothetical protein